MVCAICVNQLGKVRSGDRIRRVCRGICKREVGSDVHLLLSNIFQALTAARIVSEYKWRWEIILEVLNNQFFRFDPGVAVFSMFPHNVVCGVYIHSFNWDRMVAR